MFSYIISHKVCLYPVLLGFLMSMEYLNLDGASNNSTLGKDGIGPKEEERKDCINCSGEGQ